MADVFNGKEARELLFQKSILIIGDGNVRSFYKDLVLLILGKENKDPCCFCSRISVKLMNDRVLELGGSKSAWKYYEHRCFERGVRIDLIYMNTLSVSHIIDYANKIRSLKVPMPDLVYFSCWSRQSTYSGKSLENALSLLKKEMHSKGLLVLGNAFPMPEDSFGDPMTDELVYFKQLDKFQVTDYTNLANELRCKCLDTNYYTEMKMLRRAALGTKREKAAVRYLTLIMLTTYADHCTKDLPGRVNRLILRQAQLAPLHCVREYIRLSNRIFLSRNNPDPVLVNFKEVIGLFKMVEDIDNSPNGLNEPSEKWLKTEKTTSKDVKSSVKHPFSFSALRIKKAAISLNNTDPNETIDRPIGNSQKIPTPNNADVQENSVDNKSPSYNAPSTSSFGKRGIAQLNEQISSDEEGEIKEKTRKIGLK